MPDFREYVRRNLPRLGISDKREATIVEDLALQLEEVYESAIKQGLTEQEASAKLAAQVPSWQQLASELRTIEGSEGVRQIPNVEQRGGSVLAGVGGLIRDIRLAIKLLVKERGFSTAIILTLAFCIGANAAVFTIVYSVLMRPLPMIPESDRILLMSNRYPRATFDDTGTFSSAPDYFDRLRAVTAFDEQAVFNFQEQRIEVSDGVVDNIRGMVTTPSLFRLMRVAPDRGRIFDENEQKMGNQLKIILSQELSERIFGGENAVGREVRLTGRPFAVIGVMPRGFTFFDPEVRWWIPMPWDYSPAVTADSARHSNAWYNIGRLKPGATIRQVQSQVDALNAANLERFPDRKDQLVAAGFRTVVEPLQASMVRSVESALYLLWGAAAFVLLIGSVNILNLTLARSNARFGELATRVAIGATHRQIARQLLVESLLLAWTGGIAGIGIGFLALRVFERFGFGRIPRAGDIHMDTTVIVCALGASALVGIAMALLPVVRLSRTNLGTVLHEMTRTTSNSGKSRLLRRAVVTAQIAFTFILLTGAGLLLSSFRHLLAVDPGFKTEGILTARFNIPMLRYPSDEDAREFADRVLDAIRQVPGVVSAGMTTMTPFEGTQDTSSILPEGYALRPGESIAQPIVGVVTPGYFEAMSTPLRRGRYFNEDDTRTSAAVAIVDEKLARKFWPGKNPLGKVMFWPNNPRNPATIDEKTRRVTVVGVVAEMRVDDLSGNRNTAGAYFLPFAQLFTRSYRFAMKSATDPESLIPALRTELRKIDPAAPIFEFRTMKDRVDASLVSRKAGLMLAMAFAGIALFLSAVGIYGVLAYLVSQRTREIGIRMALGGTMRSIFGLILSEGLLLGGVGLVLGLAGTVALRGTLANQLYAVGPTDPAVIALAVAVLAVIALAASILPARRAAQVNPISVLNRQ
jgi:putative ABC transport system permease protein